MISSNKTDLPKRSSSITSDNILLHLSQPVTATQLARQMGLSADTCCYRLARLTSNRLVRCLNPDMRRSLLFWMTRQGTERQTTLRKQYHLPPLQHDVPNIDWQLYGRVCFSHRSTVIKTLSEAMQPATIKRKAFFQDPTIRMSANNVRDVIRFLKTHGIVREIKLRKKAHLLYELTDQGKHFQRLLVQAEVSS